MVKNEDSGSPSWRASLFMQTTEDVARAVAAAAAAATTVRSPRPSVVFSSKDDNGNSPLHKLQHQVSRVLKGFSQPPEVKSGTYNPEVLTSQKRQWASVQLQSLDHRPLKDPSRLFESMVVVGLHPNCDIQALQKQYFGRKSEGSGKFRSAFSGQHQSRVEPNLEPQVLFVYPPEKQLPLKYKDLLSFCFPGGVEVHAIEKTSSMSELNEILLGQDHLKQSDLSFVFRLQVADDSTLYGCCVLVEEIVQKPSGLISMISDGQPPRSGLRRHMLTTRRCYCILSRFPFFELHFSVLKSIFTEERLERLTKGISDLDLESSEGHGKEENLKENSDGISSEDRANDVLNGTVDTSQLSPNDSLSEKVMDDVCHREHQMLKNNHLLRRDMNGSGVVPVDPAIEKLPDKRENGVTSEISEACDTHVDDFVTNKQLVEKRFPNAVLPLLRYQQYESSESSTSFQGSPSEDRIFRSDLDEVETEEASFSGQEYSSDHSDILDWAKGNNHGSLQIICEYYRLPIPARGSTITFYPLEHLHPLEFHRPDETVLHIAGSTIDLKSCSSSLELAEAHSALMAEEEAKSLSVWAVALLCGSLRLENVLTLFAGALLEKQIVVISSNLGILSALVLSIIPLIRPYQWQSLLMPVLPNDMLDFLDAPVPYVVGVKNKTTEVQSKLTNAILVDANKNQVRSPTIPQLPQQKELYSYLIPYHAKLVGESFLGRKRPVYECTDAQVEAAKGFLGVLRSYLDSLCSNLRSHTITNVQSNDDKKKSRREILLEYVKSVQPEFMELFVKRAPQQVVDAMRQTVANMIGTLPPQFFTVTVTTVAENLAQLMYSVLMTGYMFRNAQYRLELQQGLEQVALPEVQDKQDVPDYAPGTQKKVSGEVIRWNNISGPEKIDAVKYIELLEAEIEELHQEVGRKSANGQNELLEYLRSLQPQNLKELTSSAGEDVVLAMNTFIKRLLAVTDPGQMKTSATETSAPELAKLLYWLMVVGYGIRNIEVHFDMERVLGTPPKLAELPPAENI